MNLFTVAKNTSFLKTSNQNRVISLKAHFNKHKQITSNLLTAFERTTNCAKNILMLEKVSLNKRN